jgi:Xaa-Pro aminopeptidase
MKRGLIAWDKSELPLEVFETRLGVARKRLADQDLPALVVYSDLAQSDLARFYSNFMPYFNRAFLVVPREDKPFLLCGLSPRVYPWIKSVTILEEILHSPNLAQKLLEICGNRGWKRVGMIEPGRLPYDLHSALQGKVEVEEVPHEGDEWELAMHRRAAHLVRDGVAAELSAGVGVSDYEFVGRLERKLRRAGAEDLVILLSNGSAAPAAATGQILQPGYSVCVDLEYRGHWERTICRHGAEAPENQ